MLYLISSLKAPHSTTYFASLHLRFEPLSKAGKNPITAVAFAEDIIEAQNKDQCDYGILSIGTESGRIEVWAVPISSNDEGASPKLICVVPSNESHFDLSHFDLTQ